MRYAIDAMPTGIFASKLELRWWCCVRQIRSDVQYVGHVDNWRDMLIGSVSVEIKPSGLLDGDGMVLDAVLQRVPAWEDSIAVLMGDPMQYELHYCKRVLANDWNVKTMDNISEL